MNARLAVLLLLLQLYRVILLHWYGVILIVTVVGF